MRTIKGALKEIKEEDPASAITKYWLRKAIKTQEIPSIKAGCKYLINMDNIDAYCNGKIHKSESTSVVNKGVRKIPENARI